ncbi:MAG: M56 family metallopeptidase [Ruminococcus sp.]|nr:M56 family metallopeptidase [Ruminococcus sp.]
MFKVTGLTRVLMGVMESERFIPSLLILLIAVVRSCFGKKIGGKFFAFLWTAAAVGLIIPFGIGIPLLPSAETEITESTMTEYGLSVSEVPEERLRGIVGILGGVAMGLYFCIGHLHTVMKCKVSLPADVDIREMRERLNIRREVDVRCCENAVSPFTYGVFRPVIILPGDMSETDGGTLRHIMGHELTHIKRWDAMRNILYAAALCINWFDPAVWVMYILARRDTENACDEEAVRAFGFSPKSYGLTLLAMEERLRLSFGAAFGKKPVKERIERLSAMSDAGRSSVMGAAAGFAAVVTAAAFFTHLERMPPKVVYVTVGEDDTKGVRAAEEYGDEAVYEHEPMSAYEVTLRSDDTSDGVTLLWGTADEAVYGYEPMLAVAEADGDGVTFYSAVTDGDAVVWEETEENTALYRSETSYADDTFWEETEEDRAVTVETVIWSGLENLLNNDNVIAVVLESELFE